MENTSYLKSVVYMIRYPNFQKQLSKVKKMRKVNYFFQIFRKIDSHFEMIIIGLVRRNNPVQKRGK